MASSRKPGPLGLNPEVQDLNDGTMIRRLSPRPGPIGTKAALIVSVHGKLSVTSLTTRTPRKKSSEVNLQVLRQGSRGPEGQKLQRQRNARLTPSPKLAVDGAFGPVTRQAVLQYQHGGSKVRELSRSRARGRLLSWGLMVGASEDRRVISSYPGLRKICCCRNPGARTSKSGCPGCLMANSKAAAARWR
jgi:hypothetical protein